METKEVVEVRFAGSKNYSPIFPVDAFWKREGNRVITYGERWPDQYRQFKEGNPQEANGTPRSYGFLLFGVKLMLVAVPEINSPGNMFGPAVTWDTEIGLGVVCFTLVASMMLQRWIGPHTG